MGRQILHIPFLSQELDSLKRRMLQWGNLRNILLFLDSNQYMHTYGKYECLLAVDSLHQFDCRDKDFTKISAYQTTNNDWLFGHINYDFKNQLQPHLSSQKTSNIAFPDFHFFVPEIVCYIKRDELVLTIESINEPPNKIWDEILSQNKPPNKPIKTGGIQFQKRIEKVEYLQIIHQLQQHIIDGDCYEINFCNEAFQEHTIINPLNSFEKLNKQSPNPFAAYYKLNDQYLICASPERYLCKNGESIIAQPIKGTARRMNNTEQDNLQKNDLLNSEKERAENVMIVDLMRNDLARFCQLGTVKVDELFGLYTFPQVHQLISTISGKIKPELSLFDAIKLSFPMGSMTGAPKFIVMQLIEQYEKARRGLFSGTVGYINPEGDFDFNVVIRSLFYNQTTGYLSYQTGGAITSGSIAEQEWEETCLKAEAMSKIFSA